jgi:hypothetical protein
VAVVPTTVRPVMPDGCSMIIAEADLVMSAMLVAVIVTDCWVVVEEGAVYKPAAETVPIGDFTDHVTAVLLVPVTVAVNC